VSLLISSGAAVNQARRDDDVAPLYIAAQEGRTKVASLLIGGKAVVDLTRRETMAQPLFLLLLSKATLRW